MNTTERGMLVASAAAVLFLSGAVTARATEKVAAGGPLRRPQRLQGSGSLRRGGEFLQGQELMQGQGVR
jgi:hypothetical protein